MKSVLFASVAALALSAGLVSANAADIQQRQMVTKAPAYVAPVYTWTGPYIGISGGYGWGNSDFSGGLGGVDPAGGLFGATLGYNWQMGTLVTGIEGDISWSGLRDSAAGLRTENNWLGTVRGRLGYNAGRWMPYITGGLAVGDIDSRIAGVGSSDKTKAGWTIGGGVEAQIAGPWSAKVEYLYVDLGDGGSIAGSRPDFTTNIVRAGLNYRF
ncbi:MAG TPA: outer membrane protein [Pseudolabrys sp.]|jgi:outer membrane immunogenic protein|nr:outer membrane protein [Pseudolabrys sp.]